MGSGGGTNPLTASGGWIKSRHGHVGEGWGLSPALMGQRGTDTRAVLKTQGVRGSTKDSYFGVLNEKLLRPVYGKILAGSQIMSMYQ